MIRAIATLALCIFALPGWADPMRMAVTTSFANSGLAEVLLPEIEAETGIELQLLIVGTGQALKLGAAGDVDAVLVHSRAAEDAFVAEGNAPHRREIMYNDFVIVGPTGDPAGVSGADNANAALRAISSAEAAFVSRGDDSGTHKMELRLWDAAGVAVEGDWYKEVGAGMGAALNTAAGLGAYILTDRATWLKFANKAGLSLLFEGDPVLFNQYAYLPVSADKHPHVKADLATQLEDWLTSPAAEALINGYEIAGERLFTFNAKPR
ncbi:ABC transporter substrate-binding protein [Ovoidimarina sediminis]|uniref:substrate-binding domain-containing protein n=1 Tax=Ovoidimarina sediminis TaxID=3079856 RepID=UPI00290AB4D5|nr:substrate-binding domain-containing protein [Rhodophyticola sp. MJ-SS7]MDU8942043.1 substrate-binding domain-containing protein [Rhodophyticola sp. MJ-SS7]